ncbi:MAG: CAP domain-containing protein [Verrucomicrobiae bacterium]|nr:CAP domain-containing protein [Verrucomicrobiae bacterium]
MKISTAKYWGTLVVAILCLESAHSQQALYEHGEPTDYEQLALEIINRTRMEPTKVAAEQGLVGLSLSPAAPLAFHKSLVNSAQQHSAWMDQTDLLSHTGANGSVSQSRMVAAGYRLSGTTATGENVGRQGNTRVSDAPVNLVMRNRSWLFASPPHRENTLNPRFKQIGIGFKLGSYVKNGTVWLGAFIVENYGSTEAQPEAQAAVLGVCFSDGNQNGRYDPGEGIPAVEVRPERGAYFTKTSRSGGYAVPVPEGANVIDVYSPETGCLRKYLSDVRANTKVDVEKNGLPKMAVIDRGSVSIPEGQELLLEAPVTGELSVAGFRWVRDRAVVAEGASSLRISSVGQNDGGTYELEVPVANSPGLFAVNRVAVVRVTEPVASRPELAELFKGWAATVGVATGETGDDDGDGLSNLFEYVVVRDPHSADGLPQPRFDPRSQQFEWNIPLNLAVNPEDVTIEVTTDGQQWEEPASSGFQVTRAPGRIIVTGTARDMSMLLLRLAVEKK